MMYFTWKEEARDVLGRAEKSSCNPCACGGTANGADTCWDFLGSALSWVWYHQHPGRVSAAGTAT